MAGLAKKKKKSKALASAQRQHQAEEHIYCQTLFSMDLPI